MRNNLCKVILVILASISLCGCTFIFQTGRRSDKQKIEELSQQLDELSRAKRLLEERLSAEISGQQVSLRMKDGSLVITVLGDVLFDSGKANIRPEACPILDKIAGVLEENVPQFNVGIEGHTDNQPIKFSGWKTNWELSTARSLSILHYLVDKKGISPKRLSAIGYGEHRPVASNDSKEGRQVNRRVEIIILPNLEKVKEAAITPSQEAQEKFK